MTTLASRRRNRYRIGPEHHGRPMKLALFDRMETVDGYTYELGRGVIEVSDVPGLLHRVVQAEVRKQFTAYELTHPEVISYQGNGAELKLMIDVVESERHPDWAVYLSSMPELDQPWSIWKPDIVVEVVSESSAKRDYEEKPPEYLAIGVFQYWIVDPIKRRLLIKTNKGGLWQDKVYKPGQKVTSPRLPGFVFDLKRVLAAGK